METVLMQQQLHQQQRQIQQLLQQHQHQHGHNQQQPPRQQGQEQDDGGSQQRPGGAPLRVITPEIGAMMDEFFEYAAHLDRNLSSSNSHKGYGLDQDPSLDDSPGNMLTGLMARVFGRRAVAVAQPGMHGGTGGGDDCGGSNGIGGGGGGGAAAPAFATTQSRPMFPRMPSPLQDVTDSVLDWCGAAWK
ncbi:MAG: hypothetical protein WDW38_006266 [Sanguina aurantia]